MAEQEYQKGEYCKACGCTLYENLMAGYKGICEEHCKEINGNSFKI